MTNFADIERRRVELNKMMTEEKERHEKAVKGIKDEVFLNEQRAGIINNGLDESLIELATHVIRVDGVYANQGGSKASQLETAIQWLIEGGMKMKRQYVGLKNYSGWVGQAVNCSYGMGPSHGSIVFSIGLTRSVREREQEPVLSEEEINAAVYYLRNIERIQSANELAARAAA